VGAIMCLGIDGDNGGRLRFQKLRVDPEVFELTQIVARERGVSVTKLLRRSRGSGRAASARQLAIYLAHTMLSRPQDVIAELFSRDRTTVAHAVQTLEDRRDRKPLEAEIARIEEVMRHAA
jgi:chromosomal replication initiation ATPase DnaA